MAPRIICQNPGKDENGKLCNSTDITTWTRTRIGCEIHKEHRCNKCGFVWNTVEEHILKKREKQKQWHIVMSVEANK